jgi:hypothetical protein
LIFYTGRFSNAALASTCGTCGESMPPTTYAACAARRRVNVMGRSALRTQN